MPLESIIPFLIRVVEIGRPSFALRSSIISPLSRLKLRDFLSSFKESKRWEFSEVRTITSILSRKLAGPK